MCVPVFPCPSACLCVPIPATMGSEPARAVGSRVRVLTGPRVQGSVSVVGGLPLCQSRVCPCVSVQVACVQGRLSVSLGHGHCCLCVFICLGVWCPRECLLCSGACGLGAEGAGTCE